MIDEGAEGGGAISWFPVAKNDINSEKLDVNKHVHALIKCSSSSSLSSFTFKFFRSFKFRCCYKSKCIIFVQQSQSYTYIQH